MDNAATFDVRLKIMGEQRSPATPAQMIDAAAYVNDTVELAWMSARETFGKDAKPEHALAIYDRIHARRLELLDNPPES